MKITPEEFLKLLRASTLSREEQKVVIGMLPDLKSEQIDQLAELLGGNAKNLEKILVKLDSDQQKELVRLQVALDKIEIPEEEK